MYDHLVTDPGCSLRWFCVKCDKVAMEPELGEDKGSTGCHSHSRIDNLVAVVEKLIEKISVFQEQMNKKCDLHLATKIESRLNALEERFQCQGEDHTNRRTSQNNTVLLFRVT